MYKSIKNIVKSHYLFLFMIVSLLNINTTYSQLVAIVNTSNNITNVTSSDFKSYFLGDKSKFPSGTNVSLVLSKEDNKVKEVFINIMGKKYNELMNIWLKKSLNDGWKSPTQFTNDSDVISYVAKTQGALGFVNASSLNNLVKPITIDGKKQVD